MESGAVYNVKEQISLTKTMFCANNVQCKKRGCMKNFEYYNPVRIIFGKKTIPRLSNLIPRDQKVLVVYGGGSIKKNGVYEQVAMALSNHSWEEFSGIEPNPEFDTCVKAVEKVKSENITFLVAVGGG